MNKEVSLIIKKIVEYKWHGEGDYDQLKKEVDSVSDPRLREVLGSYLEEAKEFVYRNAIERDVERELLEEWLLNAKPVKMRYREGKYWFELGDEYEEEKKGD